MTLLVTTVTPEYSLSVSDQRITASYGSRTRTVDEKFNKHILFGNEDYVGNISYTGIAQWRLKGVRYRLYDLISESIASIIENRPKLATLCLHICDHLQLSIPDAASLGIAPHFELHIITREKRYPVNTITVISTFRRLAPWGATDGMIYEWELGPISVFMKVLVEESDVIFGGMEPDVRQSEKGWVRRAVASGADAFEASRMASKIVKAVSQRTPAVGSSSVSVVLPANGYVDTNLWSCTEDGVTGFVPRMIMANGTFMGPSQFPVELSLISAGQHPRQSLFFKALIYKLHKKRIRRLIFRRRKGPLIPGIMGLIGLALFGSLKEGYEDFGIGARTLE
jgi:hypothetical protein